MKQRIFVLMVTLAAMVSLTACGWKSYDGKSKDEVMKIAYENGQKWGQLNGLKDLDQMIEAFKAQSFGSSMNDEDNKVFMAARDEAIRGAVDAFMDVLKVTGNSIGGYGIDMTPQELVSVMAQNTKGGSDKSKDPSECEGERSLDFPVTERHIGINPAYIDFSEPVATSGSWNNVKPKRLYGEIEFGFGKQAVVTGLAQIAIDKISEKVVKLGKPVKKIEKMLYDRYLVSIDVISTGADICLVYIRDNNLESNRNGKFMAVIFLCHEEGVKEVLSYFDVSWP